MERLVDRMPAEDDCFEPVSLGYACETKYQIARAAKRWAYPKQSEMAFRFSIHQPEHAAARFGWRLFDWQTTPLESVCEFLERDFQGVFELDDFEVTFDYGVAAVGGAINRRFGTVYVHEYFPVDAAAGAVTLASIARNYPAARRKFERLVTDFKRLLTLPGPYLYALSHPTFPDAATLERLIGLLSARSPDHRFKLLVVGREGHDSDLSSLGDRVAKAWRPNHAGDKPVDFSWEGEDTAWDRALEPYRLGFHPA